MDKYVVALYIRLSLEDKKYDSMSIESQRTLLHRHAELLGYDEIEILEFVDNGYSGTNFERPAVQELLEAVKTFRINCVMVKDFSRFGRNSIEVGYFTQQVFPLFRVRFISVSDNYDSNDHKGDTGGMEIALKYLVNEYYSKDLSVKTKTAKYMKMRRGEYKNGVYCYGYKRGRHGEMVVDEAVSDNVRLLFELASQGKNTTEIIHEMFAKKIPSPGQYRAQQGKGYRIDNCKYWDKTQILRMLKDEQYLGTFVMCKRTVREVGSSRMICRDESEWIKIPNHHPALVSKELFDKAQPTKQIHIANRQSRIYPLKGKVLCGCCNHHLHYQQLKRPSFKCFYTMHDTAEPCHRLTVYEDELQNALFQIISKQAEIILNTDSLSAMTSCDLLTEQQSEIQKQLARISKDKQQLYEKLCMKQIQIEEYRKEREHYDENVQTLQSELARLSRQLEQRELSVKADAECKELARSVQKENSLTVDLTDALIDKVYVYPNNRLEVIWKIQDFCTQAVMI